METFDKKNYWGRRQAGLRGQSGPKNSNRGYIISKDGHTPYSTNGNKPVSKKAFKKNTKRARAYLRTHEVAA